MARAQLISLVVDGTPVGAEVSANGTVIGKLPIADATLGEGRNLLVARAPGFQSESREITLAGGSRTSVVFALKPIVIPTASVPATSSGVEADAPPTGAVGTIAPASPEGSTATRDARTTRTAVSIALTGGAVLSLAFAVWKHVGWRDAQADYEAIDGCYAGLPMRGTDARCAGLYETLDSRRTLAYIGYGVSTLFIAGATILYFTGRTTSSRSSTTKVTYAPAIHGLQLVHSFY